jgi:hypothetical protein
MDIAIVVFIALSAFSIGGFLGMSLMCLLQINKGEE